VPFLTITPLVPSAENRKQPFRVNKMLSKPRHQSPKAFRYVEICQTQSSASLCDLKLGKLRIDCCFLVSKMRWGKHNDKDTGVMYLDLKFHQPTDCRVAQATITMDLHEIQEPRERALAWLDSDLEVTEFFGPQALSGERRERQVSTLFEAKPSAGFAGATAEGFGWSRTSNEVYSSRWKFTGSRFTIDSSQDESRRSPFRRYRQLVWHLEENELERQSVHRSIVHSALAFHHRSKPFYIDLNIQVKMHRWHHRVKQHLICPPRNRKATTRAKIEPDDNAESDTEFAQLVRDLDRSMTEANLHPVEGKYSQGGNYQTCHTERLYRSIRPTTKIEEQWRRSRMREKPRSQYSAQCISAIIGRGIDWAGTAALSDIQDQLCDFK
jgi:hypothetical protein